MFLHLVIALALCGTVSAQTRAIPTDTTKELEIGFDWQEMGMYFNYGDLNPEWKDLGLEFSITTYSTKSEKRFLDFYKATMWTGAIVFFPKDIFVYGYHNLSIRGDAKEYCMVNGAIGSKGANKAIDYLSGAAGSSFSMLGLWSFKFEGNMLNLSLNETLRLSLDVSGCADWLLSPDTVTLGIRGHPEDQFRYGEKILSAEDCVRGEFWWREECHQCPPGKSTVRQGDTDYKDCIDMRYISCRPDQDMAKLECERDFCPCNAYEECNSNSQSEEYGMCTMEEYVSAGVTVSAGLLSLVTALLIMME